MKDKVDMTGVQIRVARADGNKCVRCWKISKETIRWVVKSVVDDVVQDDPTLDCLCNRCVEVLQDDYSHLLNVTSLFDECNKDIEWRS